MLTLAKPVEGRTTDAIVVLTGAKGRIDRGLKLLRAKQARRMLVSGVAPGVRPRDLAREYKAPRRVFACCIDLGTAAVDTRSNAEETAGWVREHGYASVRLVTSDWHMARARMELASALGSEVEIVRDGVPSNPKFSLLLMEYHKLLLRRVALWIGAGR
ncbi:MAG: YdcF family protein [Pseudomonadota bacterium]